MRSSLVAKWVVMKVMAACFSFSVAVKSFRLPMAVSAWLTLKVVLTFF